jgi:hypothetical protein
MRPTLSETYPAPRADEEIEMAQPYSNRSILR